MSDIKLSDLEQRVFKAWDETCEDYDALSFNTIAKRTGVDRSKIRATVRRLARKGVTVFYRVTWTDDGEVHGAGYGLTKEGRAMLIEQLHQAEKQEIARAV